MASPANTDVSVSPAEAGTREPRASLWTPAFVLTYASMAFGSVHQGLLTPTLPLYVASLGYSEVTVGLVLAAFSVTSFTIRPWLGHLADSWSVRGVLGLSGALIGLPALVLAVPSVWAVTASNAVRGIGWAAFNTGGNTLLAHIAPPARRGEAASWLSLFQDVSLALGPPLALWLVSQGGSDGGGFLPVFLLATVAGLLVVGSAWMVPPAAGRVGPAVLDKAPAAEPVSGLARFYDRGVLLASLLLVCLVLAAPSMSAFAPLYARSLGIGVESLSVYYLAVGATVLVGRFTLRHFSDRYGRGPALVAGFVCGGLGLLVMATASSLAALVAAGVIFSIGQSLHQPSTLALAIDRANPLRRGAAMASFTLWFQIGAGVGSAAAGALAAGMGYTTMYLIAIATPLAGLVLVAFNWRNLERPVSTTP